ncbi:Retrovirus-related Pol polyprotein from transposon TNT 1-94, partial [Linum grandiflorum]
TRPDIAHAVGVVSRFLSNPGKEHWAAVKWILRYLRGAAVSWQSRLQKCVALSTTEAECITVTEACKEVLWLKKFLQELGIKQERYVLYCDSQSAIHLCKNPTFHSRSKHIDVRYHWIR